MDSKVEFPEYVRRMEGEDLTDLGAVTKTFPESGRFRVEWYSGGVEGTVEHVDGHGKVWWPTLTRAVAEECQPIAQGYVDRIAGPGWDVALYPPGHEGPFWALSLEGAEDWAMMIGHDDTVTWPGGVFTEAVHSWCLGLYAPWPKPDDE